MSSKTLAYSFKVWITSVFLGPLLSFLLMYVYLTWLYRPIAPAPADPPVYHVGLAEMEALLYFVAYGFMVSIPSFFLLWVGSFYLCNRDWPKNKRRLAIVLWTLLLTGGPSSIVCGIYRWPLEPTVVVGLAYFLVMLLGIFFFRFPEEEPAEYGGKIFGT